MLSRILHKADLKPDTLFVLDGLGALISALFLGFILVRFEHIVGIPATTLYFLAVFPLFFFFFDLYCLKRNEKSTGKLLTVLAFFNFGYCLISLSFAIYHRASLSAYGWIYISVELVILLVLARVEFYAGKKIIRQEKHNSKQTK